MLLFIAFNLLFIYLMLVFLLYDVPPCTAEVPLFKRMGTFFKELFGDYRPDFVIWGAFTVLLFFVLYFY